MRRAACLQWRDRFPCRQVRADPGRPRLMTLQRLLLPLFLLTPLCGQQTWTLTGPMNAPHEQQPATLLPNGQVLVLGVLTEIPCCSAGFTAELYNPTSNTWSVTASPQYPRFNHIAELLPNGKVLVATGYLSGALTATAEIYDPGTASWTLTGSLATARQFASSAVLHDGRVLVTGGLAPNASGAVVLGSPELYDPKTGLWSSAGTMIVPVWLHSMTTLPDGRVLVAGGQDADTGLHRSPRRNCTIQPRIRRGRRYNVARDATPDAASQRAGAGHRRPRGAALPQRARSCTTRRPTDGLSPPACRSRAPFKRRRCCPTAGY